MEKIIVWLIFLFIGSALIIFWRLRIRNKQKSTALIWGTHFVLILPASARIANAYFPPDKDWFNFFLCISCSVAIVFVIWSLLTFIVSKLRVQR
jgi:hypothetical protein